jgi:hypothetical protein
MAVTPAKDAFDAKCPILAGHIDTYRKNPSSITAGIIMVFLEENYGPHEKKFNHYGCLLTHTNGFKKEEMPIFRKHLTK